MRTVAKRSKVSKQSDQKNPKGKAVTAPFALTSDGQVLINAAECEGRSLEGRALFTGVLLSKEEVGLARHEVEDGVFGAVATIVGRMRRRTTASKPT